MALVERKKERNVDVERPSSMMTGEDLDETATQDRKEKTGKGVCTGDPRLLHLVTGCLV
jgi:glutamate dehydrogenase/leucine dehydrogenase